jgi:hypothetical protein
MRYSGNNDGGDQLRLILFGYFRCLRQFHPPGFYLYLDVGVFDDNRKHNL